ncbi:MAG: DUF4159 domain-containing protein [Hyphomicrobiaceae bacterium]|nr:DUF4159 domain-containing protein [Hyphomicrobiaceae bacterium]MCC0007037.1 DUF4159 domain-containing protein [Hyphomicrobiaceae bacterium]
MSIGALAFLNPWLLTGLATLPLIYWLLRTVPPRPKQVEFPPTRILVGLDNREKTPAKTPWWLMLIRLAAAALVILALAEPVRNPTREGPLKGSGPVVVMIDNGWSSATRWSEHRAMAERVIDTAEAEGRPVIILPTALQSKTFKIALEAPAKARSTLAALSPMPYAPQRTRALDAVSAVLDKTTGASIAWLADGIAHAEEAETTALMQRLASIAPGDRLTVITDNESHGPLGLAAASGRGGRLEARIMRASGAARTGQIHAFSARGERLGETAFTFDGDAVAATAVFDMPLELRNQVTRLEIAGERSAGAVALIDASTRWHRVGLISGESQEQSQPLLAPLYYIEKALAPYSELIVAKDANLAANIDTILKQNATVLMLADIGTITGDLHKEVETWVNKGGVLVRFAGPRLEKGGDELMPVPLRVGGRTLGGALSWSTPQQLAAFEEKSPFAGLVVPADVTVNRQVLADPARIGPDIAVWARLADGTPLVTAKRVGDGQIVLFHVTANSDWSNLPISGLFVDMLRRISTMGRIGRTASAGDATTMAGTEAITTAGTGPEVLAPIRTLDGFGTLSPPPPTAQAVPAATFASLSPGFDHPPGLYGPEASPRALNVLDEKSTVAPLPGLPPGARTLGYQSETSQPLKPWLLALALGLIFIDILAVVLLSMGGLGALLRRPAHAALVIAAVGISITASLSLAPAAARAQNASSATPPADVAIALKATSKVTFGYVLTGDAKTDETSRIGLTGLSRVLETRTAVTPGTPLPVNITDDEIAFYPVLYWPVLESAQSLPEATLAKIDAYMKQGGMLIFDTLDYGSGRPSSLQGAGEDTPLQRILAGLDLPRLEPVPEGHVLTKAFYLLRSFPGRWDGGTMWVEAATERPGDDDSRHARRADGVTSIVITSNDLASAWALDERGRPLYPTVPGGETQREMAFRVGVNLAMHALTGNYKADQVHVPALLERLGQ